MSAPSPVMIRRSTPRPVRILQVQCIKTYGGIDTVLLAFAREQHRCPLLESHFAVGMEGRLAEELRSVGATVLVLPSMRARAPWTVHYARRVLIQYCTANEIDAVVFHSPYPHALFGSVVRKHGVKIVHWLHNETSGTHWLERLARRVKPDVGVTVSRFISWSYPNLFPGVKPLVMWPPVANQAVQLTAAERRTIRAELGASADSIVIIQACRIDPMKGHEVHLRALSKLKTARDWVCWQAGGAQQAWEQDYYRRIQALARELGLGSRVRFLEQRADVPRLLAAADILCQPNLQPEPSGTVFVEAMYAGIPIVTTAMGGAVEGVDSTCGVLTPHNDPHAVSNVLSLLIENDNLRRRLGSAGPARATALADPQQKFELLHDALLTVVPCRVR